MNKDRGLTFDGKWVYGWYAESKSNKRAYIITSATGYDECPTAIEHERDHGKIRIHKYYRVVPKTVSRSSGVRDNNNKEIYAGDLFRTSDKHGYSSNCIAEVLFIDGAFVIQLYRNDEMEIAPELILDFKHTFRDSFEIIGNVAQDPQVLENK